MTKLSKSEDFGYSEFISLNNLAKKINVTRSTLKKLLIDKDIELKKRNETLKCSPFMISISELKEKLSDLDYDSIDGLTLSKLNNKIKLLETQIEALFKQVKVIYTIAQAVQNETKEVNSRNKLKK